MDDLKVERYSTEVKVYIGATLVLATLIVSLVWWNAVQDAERQDQLAALYGSYQDLGRHISESIDINKIAVCQSIEVPKVIEGEGTSVDEKAVQAKQEAFDKKQAAHREEVKKFTNLLTQQYSYLNERRPASNNPELMNDALLFRLNKTYNSFTSSLKKLGERCGDLSPEQVQMRKRRFDKSLARFSENLNDLEASTKN